MRFVVFPPGERMAVRLLQSELREARKGIQGAKVVITSSSMYDMLTHGSEYGIAVIVRYFGETSKRANDSGSSPIPSMRAS